MAQPPLIVDISTSARAVYEIDPATGLPLGVTGPAMTQAEFIAALKSGTGTKSTVASGIASVTILASNAARKGATIANTDANILYLDLSGGTASATSFTVALGAGSTTPTYYEVPYGYTGAITGIWAADGAGSAYVTQFT